MLQTLGTLYFILVLVLSFYLFLSYYLCDFYSFNGSIVFTFLYVLYSHSSHFLFFITIIWITEYCNQRGGKPLCVCIVVYSLSHVQFFCNPMDCSPPDSSAHGTSQARILEWVVTSFSRDLPDPGIEPAFLHWQVDSFPPSHQKSPYCICIYIYIWNAYL